MQAGSTVGNGACMFGPNICREFVFESRDLRALSDPARKNRARRSLGLLLLKPWLCHRYQRLFELRHGAGLPSLASYALPRRRAFAPAIFPIAHTIS